MLTSPLEIERKWMVKGWPNRAGEEALPMLKEEQMEQGYVSVEPTVRIRSEKQTGKEPRYIMCLKSRVDGLVRKETEFPILPEHFQQIEDIIGLPLVPKVRRTYLLSDGHHLEVNAVDEGTETAFYYAEVEFESRKDAANFEPARVGMEEYLKDEVTNTPGMSMGAYWKKVRLGQN
jgi:adenylate cyclase